MELKKCTTLDEAREKIDAVDREIVELVAKRNDYIKRIHPEKSPALSHCTARRQPVENRQFFPALGHFSEEHTLGTPGYPDH